MMLDARPALSMACVMPAFSARRFSLAIKPAGLSAPVLIFKPVLKRWSEVLRWSLFFLNTRCAMSELTLVLILLMGVCLSLTLSGDSRRDARRLSLRGHGGSAVHRNSCAGARGRESGPSIP